MKEASALKMVLIGAEAGLGDLVTNDDVSLLAACFQFMYGYPVHDPGGTSESELTDLSECDIPKTSWYTSLTALVATKVRK